jgi:Tol biopolymer transport system component
MRTTHDAITRRAALARLAATGAALASSATSRGAVDDDAEKRPAARIYVATSGRQGEFPPEVSGILAIDPKDGTWTQVAPESHTGPRVSPDGRTILCCRTRPSAERSLFICDMRGAEPPKKIADVNSFFYTWSPDGKTFLVSESKGFGPQTTWRFNADGTGRAKLPLSETERVLDWSLDGQWLLTESFRPPKGGDQPDPKQRQRPLYLVHPDGTGERLLLPAEVPWTYFPRFSPDSRAIVFGRGDKESRRGPYQLERIGLDGERRTLLRQDGADGPVHAAWSPDGKDLAVIFREDRVEGDEAITIDKIFSRIEIDSADGMKQRRLDVLDGIRISLGDWR